MSLLLQYNVCKFFIGFTVIFTTFSVSDSQFSVRIGFMILMITVQKKIHFKTHLNFFIGLETQDNSDKIAQWTDNNRMKLKLVNFVRTKQ